MLKHADFTPTCLGTWPGVISPWGLWSLPEGQEGTQSFPSGSSSGWTEGEGSTAQFKLCPLTSVSSAVCRGNWAERTRKEVLEVCLTVGSPQPGHS